MFNTQVRHHVETVDSGLRKFFSAIYQNVGYAMLLIGSVTFLVAKVKLLQYLLFKTPLFFVSIIAPIALSMYLQARLHKINVYTAQSLYWGVIASYAVMLSSFLNLYTSYSVFSAFFIAGGIFWASSYYGTKTDTDLSEFSSILKIGTWGLLGAMVLNLFIGSSFIQTLISMVCVVVFTAMIAYDSQTLRNLYYVRQSEESTQKLAILGSLQLFLSFVNVFIHLLRLTGTRRED